MLLNYLKLAIRLLTRNPFFTFINVFGLSVGFASFFALWQYSTTELKTDQHHKDFNRIARIGFQWTWNENGEPGHLTFAGSRAKLIPELKNDFPEVESYVRILEQAGFFQEDLQDIHDVRIVISHQGSDGNRRTFNQKNAAYADRTFLEFFNIPIIAGDAATALSKVNSVALSRSTALKYFGQVDAVGRELSLNDSIPLVVTAVYEDIPAYSRVHYDVIFSNEGLLRQWETAYWGGTLNFVKLTPETPFAEFESKINTHAKKYWSDILNTCDNCDISMFVQPLKDVAFSQGMIADEAFYHPSKAVLITLGVVAVVILVMAWINYVNLSIARLNNRMKEFATRRANGAMPVDLVKQFLVESFILNVLAAGLAITLLQLVRLPLSTLFEIHVPELSATTLEVWTTFLAVVASGIIATGLYPALACIARNRRSLFAVSSGTPRKSLVTTSLTVFQFAAATVLISWVFIVYLQLNHILNQHIGLDTEGVLIVDGPVVKPRGYDQEAETFARQLRNVEGVRDVTLSRYTVGTVSNKPGDVTLAGTTIKSTAWGNGVDENYVPFFGLRLLAGRNFVNNDREDVVIISRMAARELGFTNPQDALGARVVVNDGNWQVTNEAEVIGVIDDYQTTALFNFTATNTILSQGTFGLFFAYKNKLLSDLTPEYIAIKVNLADAASIMKSVETLFIRAFPGNIFEWRFMDDQINQSYAKEKIARNQILMFTILAIGIACLGLVAMMAQRVVEKTKEIGIRKILGAKDLHIGQMLMRTLLAHLVIATLIALPVAMYLGNQYLQKYAVQTPIFWWYYALPLVILLAIMFMAISSILWKAARANPVEALRME